MPTHTHIVLAGTLLAIPLSQFIQCGDVDTSGDVEPIVLGGDEEPRGFPGPNQVAKLEELGKRVFFDNISDPPRMACVTCHDPAAGWTFKNSGVNLHQVAITGANPHTSGSLKPPSAAYAKFIQEFVECNVGGVPAPTQRYCGGIFWNGRAEGNATPPQDVNGQVSRHVGVEVFEFKSGNLKGPDLLPAYQEFLGPLADQALNPFANPNEQNVAEERQVCQHVASSKYAPIFAAAFGEPIDCSENPYGTRGFRAHEVNFRRIALALAAWQSSAEVNSFSSKRDIALEADGDGRFPLDDFTEQENLGHDLFYNRRPNPFGPEIGANVRPFPNLPITNCSFCHLSSLNPDLRDGTDPQERYTDDAYHNIGTPANPEIPGGDVGPDLKDHTAIVAHRGFLKTPTLRNVGKKPGAGFTKAYAHNGWFKSLEAIVHFYNTANVNLPTAQKLHDVTRCPPGVTTEKDALARNCWPAPKHSVSAIGVLVGNLGLTPAQEAAIVAYLKTLTDTETPKAPKPYK